MSKSTIIGLGLVVVAVVVGGVWYTSSDEPAPENNNEVEGAATSSEQFAPELIDAMHQYNGEEGTHIVAGEVEVPTACHLLETDVTVDETSGDATVDFTASVEDEDQMCAQVITQQPFSVTFEASEEADIQATYNGESVELNLREVGPDEDLEDFEVYTKG